MQPLVVTIRRSSYSVALYELYILLHSSVVVLYYCLIQVYGANDIFAIGGANSLQQYQGFSVPQKASPGNGEDIHWKPVSGEIQESLF